MLVLDNERLREHIDATGIKQKVIADSSNMSETALCLVISGKRKCEAGEYANICKALGVPMDKFLSTKEVT